MTVKKAAATVTFLSFFKITFCEFSFPLCFLSVCGAAESLFAYLACYGRETQLKGIASGIGPVRNCGCHFALFPYVSDTSQKHRKTKQNGLRQIRRVRSRTAQSYLMECLKVLYFIVLLHSLAGWRSTRTKIIGKRNCFNELQRSSRRYFEGFLEM